MSLKQKHLTQFQQELTKRFNAYIRELYPHQTVPSSLKMPPKLLVAFEDELRRRAYAYVQDTFPEAKLPVTLRMPQPLLDAFEVQLGDKLKTLILTKKVAMPEKLFTEIVDETIGELKTRVLYELQRNQP